MAKDKQIKDIVLEGVEPVEDVQLKEEDVLPKGDVQSVFFIPVSNVYKPLPKFNSGCTNC